MSPPAGRAVPVLIVRAGGESCALPIESVVETLRPGGITPIPGAPGFVRGLMAIRGAAVPVVELAELLGMRSSSETPRLVVTRSGDRRVALWVDEVVGVARIQTERLEELPPLVADVQSDVVEKVGMLDSRLMLVLRASRLLPADALAGLPLPEVSP